jgi:hypothetical protein
MPDDEAKTPWDRAKEKTESKSHKQERTFARGRGRQQPNSGRRWHSPGDVMLDTFIGRIMVDNKTHDDPEKKSFRIIYDEWMKLRSQAMRTPPGCVPALQIDLQDLHLFVMELGLWDEIISHIMMLETSVDTLTQALKVERGEDGQESD